MQLPSSRMWPQLMIKLKLPKRTKVWWAILTQLVIVGEAKSINVSLFRESKGEVRPTEGICEVNLPFDFHYLWFQQPAWNHRTHSQPDDTTASIVNVITNQTSNPGQLWKLWAWKGLCYPPRPFLPPVFEKSSGTLPSCPCSPVPDE